MQLINTYFDSQEFKQLKKETEKLRRATAQEDAKRQRQGRRIQTTAQKSLITIEELIRNQGQYINSINEHPLATDDGSQLEEAHQVMILLLKAQEAMQNDSRS